MLSNEHVLRYSPPISLFYVAIMLISFTFSLTFFEYTNFLSFKKSNNKNAQVVLNQVTGINKEQANSDSNSNKNEKSTSDSTSNKNDKIDKSKEDQIDEKKLEKNDDQKKEEDIKNEIQTEKNNNEKKNDINDEKKDDEKLDKDKKDDEEKKSHKKDDNDKKDEESSANDKDEESTTTFFENGRTFDRLYSKTHSSPFYSKEFPKLEADTEKMEAVKEAFLHAWSNYDKYCFGHDTFHPMSRQCHDSNLGGGLTIIDSISTIIVMGLEKPYKKVRNFVKNQFELKGSWSLFEFNIRYLGGLLSAYSLSHDKIFKKAAVGIGDAINNIMEKTGGFFAYNFNIRTTDRANYQYSAKGTSSSSGYSLAECGTFQLEFFELAEITGDEKYVKSALNVYKKLWKNNPSNGLISSHIGAGTDSYYEYVIKSYLMTGGVGKEMLRRHILLMDDLKSQLVFKSLNKGLTGIGSKGRDFKHPNSEVEHLATFAGGMIALGSVKENENHEEDLKLASELATTYAKTYANFKSGIMPEHVIFNTDDENDKEDIKMVVDGYILRPETVESIFYLYRFTGDQKYRDYNWQIFKAVNSSCRVKNGFTSISRIESEPENVKHKDEMESFFLAETLKYLYLTFADSSLISQVEWVFNTEAHPLHMWSKETVEKFSNDIDVQITKSLNRAKIHEIDRTKKRRDIDKARRNREK